MPKNYLLIFLGVLLFASLISALPKADAAPVVFDSTITLEGVAGTSAIDPSISVSGDLVWVVWVEEISGAATIMMKNSTDGGTTFGTVTDLSQNVANSVDPPICPTIDPSNDFNNFDCRGHPQVYANGTNAYVVWQDEEGYSGNGIDTDFLGDVFYRKISYSGSSFTITPALASSPLRINAQGGGDYALTPVIAASATGPYVHVVWIGTGSDGGAEDDHVFHSRSTDSGATFTATKTILSPNIGILSFVMRPDIAVDGSNVYAVWEDQMDAGGPFADILFSASSDNGNIFNGGSAGTAGNPKNLVTNDITSGNTGTDASLHPQIAAAGGNAYVVWDDVSSGQQEIFYRNSTDVGSTFGPVLSSTATLLSVSGDSRSEVQPQIGTNTDGSKVFVTWAKNTDADIIFRKSIDSGVTFDTVQNIDTAGTDLSPKLDSLGDNLYITWQDTSVGSGDIFFTSSSDAGTTFANKQNLSGDGTLSATPQLDSASSHVVWVDAPGGNSNILTQSGVFGLDLSWNATDYRLSEVGTITLLTGSGLGTIDVTVSSGVDAGFTKTLTETATGTYTGSITFSETATNSGSSILKVAVGDTITVEKDGTDTDANIFPRTVAWEFGTYTKGDGKVGGTAVQFTVTNEHTNVDPLTFENILVTVSSLSTGNVITITANETGIDTGLFKNVNLIFSTGISTAVVGDTTTITQEGDNGAGYAGNAIIDTFNMDVKSTTFPTGISLVMTETSTTSNSFTATLFLNSTAPPAGPTSIQVDDGDILSLTYNGATENVMINPTNATVGALSSAIGDTVTATYLTASDTALIINDGAGGGGGGGVSRAGLVVNALAGVSSLSGGGGTDGSPPITSLGQLITNKNFEIPSEIEQIIVNQDPLIPLEPIPLDTYDFDFPLSINENGFALGQYSNTIKTTSLKTGEPVSITALFYEQTAIQHVSMYLNLRDINSGNLAKSDTQILYNKDKPLQIIDPNGYFDKVDVIISEDEDTIKKFATFEIVFAKSMEKSDIVLRAWDDKFRSRDTIILDAIQVFDQESYPVDAPTEVETSTLSTSPEPESLQVPEWIKINVKYWSEGEMDDSTFINGLEFLVQQGIIDVPTTANVSKDPDQKEEEILEPEPAQEIPDWIKKTAQWWSEDLMSEKEFIQVVEYLIKTGAIKI